MLSIESLFSSEYTGRAKKSIQFSYGYFSLSEGDMSFRFIKQKFLVRILFSNFLQYNNKIFNVNDIFGVDNTAANISDESQRDCIVCLMSPKDTVVLPCRHMCLCSPCSQVVRMQSNKCPICRTKISSFMQIKIEARSSTVEQRQAVTAN